MIEIEQSSGNVYADLDIPEADEMLVKAQLAAEIGEIIKRQGLSQSQAAEILGLPQPKISNLLRGQFRGISQAKLLECLIRLGRDVQIVVKPAQDRTHGGRIEVVIA